MAPLPRVVVSFLAVALLLSSATAHTIEELESIPFTYTGDKGPDKWGKLDPEFTACESGKSQSPINILKKETVASNKLTPLTRVYKPTNATLVSNGFSVGIHYEQDNGVLLVDGKNYTLKQLHWHVPSEHRINGEQFAAELHLVHKAGEGNFAVVGILYALGDADPFISKLQTSLEKLANEKCGSDEEVHIALGTIDTKQIKKNTRKYYRYAGSLTTPPCSEQVIWNVLGKVRSISKEQVEALKAPLSDAYKNNARPLQQLNERKVELYDEMGDDDDSN